MSFEPAPPDAPGGAQSIISPTVDEWRALSPEERERFLVRVLELNAKADRNEAEIAEATARVEQATALADQATARADQATTRAAQATTRADQATARAEQMMGVLRDTLLALFEARGLAIPEQVRARVVTCDDPTSLQRWILRASTASSATEALSTP